FPAFTHAPPGRANPPFVATRILSRWPIEAIKRSLCPMSSSSRQYTSAVSINVIPASIAAFNTRRATSSGGRPLIDKGIPPNPILGRASILRIITPLIRPWATFFSPQGGERASRPPPGGGQDARSPRQTGRRARGGGPSPRSRGEGGAERRVRG